LLKNTDNYNRLAPILGISHVNPSMTPEEAAAYLPKSTSSSKEKPHWIIGNY